jgi:hypothetical protein
MTRSILAALLMVALSATMVQGQARLLPPSDSTPVEAIKTSQLPEAARQPHLATLGTPTSAPSTFPAAPEVPQNAPPLQLYGREPAHGIKTGGIPQTPEVPASEAPTQSGFTLPEVCGPSGRFWAELDFLVWWVPGDKPPALLTTSPSGTSQSQAGILGAAGTSVLAGGREFNDDARAGFRLNAGYWLDPLQTMGIQAGGFWLDNNNSSAAFAASGNTILARPFFNVLTGKQDAELIAFPGVASGSAVVSGQSSLNGWDVAWRENACCCCNMRIDALLGYRQLRLADQLGIDESTTSLGGGVPAGTQILRMDRIDTTNDFYGAERGVVGEYRYQGWVVEGLAKMTVGWNASQVNINGTTLVTPPGQPPVANSGGLLALPSNIGQYRSGDATLIPEFGVNVAYNFNDHLRLRCGYSLLYWDHVDRPGQQIDTGVNPNLVPPAPGGPPARPMPTQTETDLFVNGINVGVEVRY